MNFSVETPKVCKRLAERHSQGWAVKEATIIQADDVSTLSVSFENLYIEKTLSFTHQTGWCDTFDELCICLNAR